MNIDYNDISEKSEFFYIALSIFLSREEKSVIPEIMTFMSSEQVMNFIKIFGGYTVKVPSEKEFSNDLYAAIIIYYRCSEKLSWGAIQNKLKLSARKLNYVKKSIIRWINFLEKEGLKSPIPLDEIFSERITK